ncbi:AAA domain-containing protein [Streptomyces bobili]|uniref:AAA domain-containing protein n=1 Tax=Streptomyces bobili TaxID=67280 RepID=UPI001180DB13|nr:AAA domain-containing protein [Streptomyces bobili]
MPIIIGQRFALPDTPTGEGGHAKLFKSVDLENDNRTVAVKVFNPSRILDDRVLKAAWTNELSAYQALGDHPNLARMIDWGRCDDGAPYLVFEWLEKDLLDGLETLKIEGWDDFWPIARDILSGLEVIHSEGFVHRDIKPENILVSENGRFKVADFGTTRLAETVSLGQTMAPLGTIPYAPDERGTRTPTAAYDIYSFTVLAIVCLSGQIPADETAVRASFETLDLPPEIYSTLAPCLSNNTEERAESAGVLRAQLSVIQDAREQRRNPEIELFLDLPNSTIEAFRKQYQNNATKEQILEDIAAVGALSYDARVGAVPDLQIAGQTYILRTQPHRTRQGILRVFRIQRAPAQLLEFARANWHRPKVKLRLSVPTDPVRAASELANQMEMVTERDAERAESQILSAEEGAFSDWRSTLNAKFFLENGRGTRVTYDKFRRDGNRVRFTVADGSGLEPGESRLVRSGNRRVLFGEVEGVENNEAILYITKGNAAELPRHGTLEFDSEASKSKLKRERDALDQIVNRKSTRPDLRDILLDPRKSTTPQPVEIGHYAQANLDEAKKEAVAASLGARDFLLVQGPPGTGKTTFIAELVAQHLRSNPQSRIVLTSQTHIALDNALLRIQELEPTATLLRLGRSDRLAQDVEPLSIIPQMDKWRTSVLNASREFIKEYAARLGIDLDATDLKNSALELQRRQERALELESQLDSEQSSRRALVQEIERINSMAGPILDMASTVESAAQNGSGTELAAAAEQFIQIGLDLASRLETGGPLGENLVEMEARLGEWREDLQVQINHRETARRILIEEMGKDSNISTEDLIKSALSRSAVDDPRLTNLQAIASDWEERFGRSKDFTAVLIARAQVVAATCVGLMGVPGADSMQFDLCIIDEASKATTTESLVPLAASRRWVLVGDNRQLPPFVEQTLEAPSLLDQFNLTREQIRETLFSVLSERLPDSCKFSLTHQHRMYPAIGQLVSKTFYDGRLTSETRRLSPVVEMALGTAVVWMDTRKRPDKRESRSGKSMRNKGEARVIAGVLDRLQWVAEQQQSGYLSVAVLTGYEAQRREITETLAGGELGRSLLKVKVATVDSYQGQEADIAIFSITRSNDNGELGFLRSEERVNVAVSRARDGLVIVGDAGFIESSPDSVNPLYRIYNYMVRSNDCTIETAAKE